jgi:hypothetical protein
LDGLLEIEVGEAKGEESIRGKDLNAEPLTGSGFRLLRTALTACGFTAVINRLEGTFPEVHRPYGSHLASNSCSVAWMSDAVSPVAARYDSGKMKLYNTQ